MAASRSGRVLEPKVSVVPSREAQQYEVATSSRVPVIVEGGEPPRGVNSGGTTGGDANAPKPPTLEERILSNADSQSSLGTDWLNFAKDQWNLSSGRQAELDELYKKMSAEQLELTKQQLEYTRGVTNKQSAMADAQLALATKVANQQMQIADWQFQVAKEDRERYNTKFKPIEDQFIAEASNYASPERLAQVAAEAKADVLTAAEQSKEAARRQSAAMGINPNSGRFAGIERAGELGTALASAGAQNNARTAAKDKGLALKADVANLGRGLAATSAQATALGLNAGSAATSGTTAATGLGLQAGNSAIGNMNSAIGLGIDTRSSILGAGQTNQSMFNNSTSIVNPGFGGALTGLQGQGATLGNFYNTQVGIQQHNQQRSDNNFNGIMGAIGTGLGLFLSDENVKEDKRPIPEGEALDKVIDLPVESWRYKEGVADEGEHVGTYAQDFQEVTGKGDGHTIPAQDAIGLTMKAVQDLNSKVDRLAKAVGIAPPAKKKPAQLPLAA
ncbi:Chaperone of endosialidase [Devosia crocina]|uniref:Chaperone of endosialidase n=1 Tax=Devosia crocina TaxID=429728 RepID=A0A1I7N9P3_9HYPH|nr:tail fiber domain-containing protein [Devosia crocina]SFV31387.1 Chaperone of endosialidase [Devosia crocina]